MALADRTAPVVDVEGDFSADTPVHGFAAPFPEPFTFAHLAAAAFLAISFRRSGDSVAGPFFTLACPPFLPISLMTFEIIDALNRFVFFTLPTLTA